MATGLIQEAANLPGIHPKLKCGLLRSNSTGPHLGRSTKLMPRSRSLVEGYIMSAAAGASSGGSQRTRVHSDTVLLTGKWGFGGGEGGEVASC